jgi:hypothetical protein
MLFILAAVLAVVSAFVIVNVRLAGRRKTVQLGSMSEQWLVRHRASDLR